MDDQTRKKVLTRFAMLSSATVLAALNGGCSPSPSASAEFQPLGIARPPQKIDFTKLKLNQAGAAPVPPVDPGSAPPVTGGGFPASYEYAGSMPPETEPPAPTPQPQPPQPTPPAPPPAPAYGVEPVYGPPQPVYGCPPPDEYPPPAQPVYGPPPDEYPPPQPAYGPPPDDECPS